LTLRMKSCPPPSDKDNTTTTNIITPIESSNRKEYEILSKQIQDLTLQLQEKEAELTTQGESLRKEFEESSRTLRKEFEERERTLARIKKDSGDVGGKDYDRSICSLTITSWTMTTRPFSTSMSLLSESSADSTTRLSLPQQEQQHKYHVSATIPPLPQVYVPHERNSASSILVERYYAQHEEEEEHILSYRNNIDSDNIIEEAHEQN